MTAHEVAEGGLLGARVPRVEDARLLSGRGRYLADIQLPAMLHVAFHRAWPAHARIRSIDVSEAKAAPGVVAVLTAEDLPEAGLVDGNLIPGLVKTRQPSIARDRVRYSGEVVALVVAEDRYLAEDAAELVQVDYEVLPAVMEAGAPRPAAHVPLFDDVPEDCIYDAEQTFGEPDAAFASARHIFRKEFYSARSTASPMEGRGCIASYDPTSEGLEIWSSNQGPHLLRRKLALSTGLAEHRVKVHMHDVGGAFGQKIPAQVEEVLLAQASIRLCLPLKWVEDRREHLLSAPHAREQRLALELAMDGEGRMLALRADVLGDAGGYSHNSTSALIECYLAVRGLLGPYRVESYAYHVRCELTNKSPIAPYRGVGMVAAQAARELLIDEAAHALGMDRVELRRRNLVREFPYRNATGLVFDSGSYVESLERVAEMAGYAGFAAEQARAREAGRYLGLGITPLVEPGGWGTEGTNQIGWHSFPSNDSARVSLDVSGKATVQVGTTSQGQGMETVMAQVVADVLGLPLKDVRVDFTDTSSTPISLAGTRGSRSAVVSGGALGLAAADVREKVLRVAGEILEADPGDLVVAGGVVSVKGSPDRSKTVAEVVGHGWTSLDIRAIEPEPNFQATRFYDPGASYSNASVAAVVEVDPGTGEVKVQRIFGVEDGGTIINPLVADGQFAGALTQGLGQALLERIAYNAEGQLLTTTFMDYLLPTAAEVPRIEIEHLSSPSPNTWRGIKGIGESGCIGGPAAIALAVADALAPFGARVEALPLTPEVVTRLIDGAAGR